MCRVPTGYHRPTSRLLCKERVFKVRVVIFVNHKLMNAFHSCAQKQICHPARRFRGVVEGAPHLCKRVWSCLGQHVSFVYMVLTPSSLSFSRPPSSARTIPTSSVRPYLFCSLSSLTISPRPVVVCLHVIYRKSCSPLLFALAHSHPGRILHRFSFVLLSLVC
jgi:hypothetical protein